MKVIETFMIRDEIDLLLVHLEELDSVVSRWVIVESETTHRGNSKPLHLRENWARLSRWHDKITRVVASPDLSLAPWPREHAQRDKAMEALACFADPGDVILISDADEFPPRGFDYSTVRPVVAFDQRMAMYAVDWIYPEPHRCSVAATWRYVRANGGLAAVRDGRYGYRGVTGGWHLTWLGGVEAQRKKLQVTCHTEMTEVEYNLLWSGSCYFDGVHHSGKLRMLPVEVDESWPGEIYRRNCPDNWFRPRREHDRGETELG